MRKNDGQENDSPRFSWLHNVDVPFDWLLGTVTGEVGLADSVDMLQFDQLFPRLLAHSLSVTGTGVIAFGI
ncbi:MAG: hypothetical protein WBH86_04960 [Thermogutta sp.]|nr:hypothetical protein [Thermogutta sp.]HOP78107.1 hypothetical protein [Thermogutta sp.]